MYSSIYTLPDLQSRWRAATWTLDIIWFLYCFPTLVIFCHIQICLIKILQQLFWWRGSTWAGLTPKRHAPTAGKQRHVRALNVTCGHTFSASFVFMRQFERPKIIFEINCGRGRKRVNIFLFIFLQLLCNVWKTAVLKGKRAPSVWDFLKFVILYLWGVSPLPHTHADTHTLRFYFPIILHIGAVEPRI